MSFFGSILGGLATPAAPTSSSPAATEPAAPVTPVTPAVPAAESEEANTKPYQNLGETVSERSAAETRYLATSTKHESELEKPYLQTSYPEMHQDDPDEGSVSVYEDIIVSCEPGPDCAHENWCLAGLKGIFETVTLVASEGELLDYWWEQVEGNVEIHFFVNSEIENHVITVTVVDTNGNEGVATLEVTCVLPDAGTATLIAYWKLDETTGSTGYDSEGSYDISFQNIEVGDWLDDGISLDGSNEYGDTGATFQSVIRAGFSFSTWIHPQSGAYAYNGLFGSSVGTNPTNSDGMAIRYDTTGIGLYLINLGSYFRRCIRSTFPGGSLFHLVWTYGSDDVAKLYYDGVSQTLTTDSKDVGFSLSNVIITNDCFLGATNTNGSYQYPFKTYLYSTRLYQGVLTQAEVTALYNAGTP